MQYSNRTTDTINIENRILENKETQNPNYNMIVDFKIKGRKPIGRKIQKIDPNNLQNIIKVYDSMIYLLRSPENKGYQKSSIQTATKNNTTYKGFRWNFIEEGNDPNISNILPTKEYKNKAPIIDTILKLNLTKTEILESYFTKNFLAKELNLSKIKIRHIIEYGEKYNDNYYIEYYKCDKELLNKYTKPINRIIPNNSKQIKQINPITKDIVIFNNLSEIYIKFGIASTTILNVINEKILYNGFLWEYYNQ